MWLAELGFLCCLGRVFSVRSVGCVCVWMVFSFCCLFFLFGLLGLLCICHGNWFLDRWVELFVWCFLFFVGDFGKYL